MKKIKKLRGDWVTDEQCLTKVCMKIDEIIEVLNEGIPPEEKCIICSEKGELEGAYLCPKHKPTPSGIEEVLRSYITHILWYHDKECGRTEDVEIIFASRIKDLAAALREYLKGIIDECDNWTELRQKLGIGD